MIHMSTVGVIEIGGTHATSALIMSNEWAVRSDLCRVEINSHADADSLLNSMAAAANGIQADQWGIAMPDPFDYVQGVGRFRDVGKFDALDGVDVRSGLAQRLGVDPDALAFCNDADAFTLGEWAVGAGRGTHRCVGLTLGTGVGSGWTIDGHVVDPGSPPGGRIHRLHLDGKPLEDTMSRRAIRAAYATATDDASADVHDIATRARAGEQSAITVLRTALSGLGRALAAPVLGFGADVLVVGGSMTGSWDLLEPWVIAGWTSTTATAPPPVRRAERGEEAPLIGAAIAADT